MINSLSPETKSDDQGSANGLSLTTFTQWMDEIQQQPAWRTKADRQMEYVDGNQLDSEILERMRQIGMPPAIEPLIGPAVESVVGFEAKTRTDWRLTADSNDGKDVAEALNFKLNQAERQSGADRACSDAFRPQYCVGIGWVEVARESDPFKFPYRCAAIPRNEIWWDMKDREPGLPNARWLIRRRWSEATQVKLKFPDKADLITHCMGGWTDRFDLSVDGGRSTDLATAWNDERGWSVEEQEWRQIDRGRVCLFEVWDRRWENVAVIKSKDGRVVEYDPDNMVHMLAVATGTAKPQKATVARMYCSFWMGPHKLYEGKSPYLHSEFPYVLFRGHIEDRTGVPYGAVKGMMYLQDNVNSATSKIRWGLSATRTTRTKGAVADSDEVFRQKASRVDADIILDDAHMAKQGAVFKVERDFQLTQQQYQMLQDSRAGIERLSVPSAFQGQKSNATSGLQESTQIEQAHQSLAGIMDNFKFARTKVGELLLSLIVQDMAGQPQEVEIAATPLRDGKKVSLNVPTTDEATGLQYLTNDVERVRLKVAMADVPSTPSFRNQQLNAMSEAFKAMPQQLQIVALPHLLALMDVPDRDKLIEDIRAGQNNLTPEAVQKQIDQAVQQALQNSDHALRARELDLKYNPDKLSAEIEAIVAKNRDVNASAVEKSMRMFFASGQTAQMLAAVPQLAPLMDALAKACGYIQPNPAGIDPNVPVLAGPAPGIAQNSVKDPRTGTEFMPGAAGAAPGDTSPTTPANPAVPASPETGQNHGIQTMRPDSVGVHP